MQMSMSGTNNAGGCEAPPISDLSILFETGKPHSSSSTSQSSTINNHPHRTPKRKLKKSIAKEAGEEESMLALAHAIAVQHSYFNQQARTSSITSGGTQLASAQRTSSILDDQVKALRHENGELKDFVRDILYTLNARGYESIKDCRGGIINLTKCRGENLLDLKGRDARVRQCATRRIHAQEHLLKAVIGSQEKLIRNLVVQAHSNRAAESVETRFNAPQSPTSSFQNGDTKVAQLEKEILSLVATLESVIERNPAVLKALQDYVMQDPNRSCGSNAILSAVLSRHQLIAGLETTPPRQQQEGTSMFGSHGGIRPRTPSARRRQTLLFPSSSGSTVDHRVEFTKSSNNHREKCGIGARFPTSIGQLSKYGNGSIFLRPMGHNHHDIFNLPQPSSQAEAGGRSDTSVLSALLQHGRRPATSINEYSSNCRKFPGTAGGRWGV